jgi:hypothetical protein
MQRTLFKAEVFEIVDVIPAFANHRPIGTICSLSQAVSSAKEFARVLFFTTTMPLQ